MSGSDSPTFFHGQPWSSWIEKIGRDKPLSDEEPDAEPASSVMRLSADDIDLYGFCPERDTFYGVVCEICNSIVKPQALIQHMESRHPSGTPNLPPPTANSVTKQVMKTPYCKLSKLKKSQTSQLSITNNSNNGSSNSKTSNNHTPIKQRTGEQQPNAHIGISGNSPRSPLESSGSLPCIQSSNSFSNAINTSGGSPVKSPGNQPKRKRLKTDRSLLKDREYDPDRHCGVWNEETGKPCTRSLTCKAHTISLRRHVAGRSKSFDKLLADHRATKELPNARAQVKVTGTTTTATTSVTGSISIATAELNTANVLAPATPLSVAVAVATSGGTAATPNVDLEAPSSPPVLSLPDTYPLPQAVDLLYRCLAPHGTNKPTKLEENFANEIESNRRIEPPLVSSNTGVGTSCLVGSSASSLTPGGTSSVPVGSDAAMAPISVVLPSLSPIQTGCMSPQAPLLQQCRSVSAASPIGKKSPASVPVVPVAMPISNQPTPPTTAALEAKTAPIEMDPSQNITMYTSSPVYKDPVKPQLTLQVSRTDVLSQAPIARSGYTSIFDTHMEVDSLIDVSRATSHALTNGKRLSNHQFSTLQSQVGNRPKHEYTQEYGTAIQLEATTASQAPFTNFNDISWSSCHPEPLAVNRWLRINSRKQYNFNIH